MTQSIQSLRDRISRRIAYRRTLNALRSLPLNSRLDLGLAGKERRAAHRAVYGC